MRGKKRHKRLNNQPSHIVGFFSGLKTFSCTVVMCHDKLGFGPIFNVATMSLTSCVVHWVELIRYQNSVNLQNL